MNTRYNLIGGLGMVPQAGRVETVKCNKECKLMIGWFLVWAAVYVAVSMYLGNRKA